MNKYLITSIVCQVFIANLHAQDFKSTSIVEGTAFYADNDALPFWMVSNNNGAFSPKTSIFLTAATTLSYEVGKNSKFNLGVSIFGRDGVNTELQRNELYLQYSNKWVDAIVGSKNPEKRFQGLSVVDDNFLLSGNTRALPGLLIKAPKDLKISENLILDYGIAHYVLNDNRYVEDAKVHYKKLGLGWQFNSRSRLYAGIEHYAQWGGNSPEFGKQEEDLNAFYDVFLAKRAGDNATQNDVFNALGNHMGMYNVQYDYVPASGSFSVYHQHPFEDGSGTGLKNFPDGIWGFYYAPNTETHTSFINGFLLEYVQTTSQSGAPDSGSGGDNYFNNGIYLSGWTYENRVIGLPLLTTTNGIPGITNNRVKAYHLGMTAEMKQWSFLTKVSYADNFGTYVNPYPEKEQTLYSKLDSKYTTEKYGAFTLHLGFDYSNLQREKYGAGVSYSYTF